MEIRLLVRGDRACFKRPEFAQDVISYDVITPRAACGIVAAVSDTPDLIWQVNEIRVLRPIRSTWMALAEVEAGEPGGPLPSRIAGPADRWMANVLSDVAYLLTMHVDVPPGDHVEGLWSAATAERFFRRPFLGMRQFPADVVMLEPDAIAPVSALADSGAIDLGWMLFDRSDDNRGRLRFFRAMMVDGVIDLRRRDALILAG